MPGPKQPPVYFESRSALNQHLHRHHAGYRSEGMLRARLDDHEELHAIAKRLGVEIGHSHEPCGDGETDIELGFRLLREGEDGQKDATKREG